MKKEKILLTLTGVLGTKNSKTTESRKEKNTPAMSKADAKSRIKLLQELAKKTRPEFYQALIYWSDRDLERLLAYYNL